VSEPAAPQHALLRPGIVIPFALTALIWGSTWYAIKDQLAAAPVEWSVTWRFALAAAGMFVLARLRGADWRMAGSGHLFALAVGVTQFFFNYNLVYQAELYITSGVVAVLYALMIPGNAVLASLFLGEPITRRFVFASAIGLSGTALLLVHEARMAELHGLVWFGLALTAVGIITASAANVLQAMPAARRQPTVVLLAWAMLYGALLDAAWALVISGPPVLPLEPRYLGAVAYLAIVGSVVTFPLYFQLIRELGAGRAAYINAVIPVIAMLFSTLLEGYRWTLLAAAGAALALLGTVLALRARRPSR
jgi:drug/metabolite transporter (DMT)-like permease